MGTKLKISNPNLSFMQWITKIHFPEGSAFVLIEVDQGGVGSSAAPVTINGLPFANSINLAPGGLVFGTGASVTPNITRPMIDNLFGWSTPYQFLLVVPPVDPNQGVLTDYAAISYFLLNVGHTQSKYSSWKRTFSVTVPGTQGNAPSPGATEYFVWFYASHVTPVPASPFDPRIAQGVVANDSDGGILAVLRTDEQDTIPAGEFPDLVRRAFGGDTTVHVPILDGGNSAKAAAVAQAFAQTANPPIPLPPPFSVDIFVVSSYALPPGSGQTCFNSMEVGLFNPAQKNTYDQAFLGGNEAFSWYVPSSYKVPHAAPPEAVTAPVSVKTVSSKSSLSSVPGYTKSFSIDAKLKTLTMT